MKNFLVLGNVRGKRVAMNTGTTIKSIELDVHCFGCDDEQTAVITEKVDWDEVIDMARADVGYNEWGYCPICVRQQEAEDAADKAMRDRKALLEG